MNAILAAQSAAQSLTRSADRPAPKAASTIPPSDAELHAHLDTLSRPRLLVEAARHGTAAYHRRRDLRRMLRVAIPATARLALQKLVPMEAELERRRTGEGKSYSLARHIDILTALMAESATFKAAPPKTPRLQPV